MLNESKQYKTHIFDVDMWKSYLNCGLKWSLKCVILTPYLCSIEKNLQNSGLNGIRTLNSEMAVQLPVEQSGLPPSYVSSVKETATTTHSKLQHKTIPFICKIIHAFFLSILKWQTHYPCQWIVDTVLAFVCNFIPISLSPSLSNVRQHPCSQSYWEKLLLNNN